MENKMTMLTREEFVNRLKITSMCMGGSDESNEMIIATFDALRARAEAAEAEVKRLQSIIDDYQEGVAKVLDSKCPTDERHCGCVPILKERIAELEADIKRLKDWESNARGIIIRLKSLYLLLKKEHEENPDFGTVLRDVYELLYENQPSEPPQEGKK